MRVYLIVLTKKKNVKNVTGENHKFLSVFHSKYIIILQKNVTYKYFEINFLL